MYFQDEDNSMFTIPDEWISTTIHENTSCRWPQHLAGKTLEKVMKEIMKPTKGCASYKIKIPRSRSMFTRMLHLVEEPAELEAGFIV